MSPKMDYLIECCVCVDVVMVGWGSPVLKACQLYAWNTVRIRANVLNVKTLLLESHSVSVAGR